MSRTRRLEKPRLFGKYQLTARLAHGRMGDVYKAKSHGVEGFEKILVVKIIEPALSQNAQFVESLIEETKRTVSLSHANVAQVYDLGQDEAGGAYYIAQEYVNGFDLGRADQLHRQSGRPRPLELAIFIASEIAKGLDYAHRRKDYNFNSLNLVHRDISPQNVLLSLDGEVKLTDFGISRALSFVPPSTTEEAIRRVLYKAPEVFRGETESQQSDIFSLGLLLYEMLAGRHPYQAKELSEVERRARRAELPPITDFVELPRPLLKILDSMLVPDPAGRARSAGGIYEELVAYIFGNKLRADPRALSLLVQELRREEQRHAPEETTQEVGMEEISMLDLQFLGEAESDATGLDVISDATNAELPSAKIQSLIMGSEGRGALPGALEDLFASVKAGSGKAVLVDGQLGAGRQHLADRLPDGLGWRGNTRVFSLQTTLDDHFSPFGVLGDLLLEAVEATDRADALQRLTALGLGAELVDTLAELWGLREPGDSGLETRKARLSELTSGVLHHLARSGPLVLVIDRVERVDDVSLEVLRDIVGRIGERSLMLVLCTSNAEMMRAAFDIGRPENLEALRVVGTPPPELHEIADLSELEASLLSLIALAGKPMSQADLAQVLGMSGEQVMGGLRTLVERGIVRVPHPGIFTSGIDELVLWVEQHLDRLEIEQRASALARYFTHRLMQSDVDRMTPTLMRLYAFAGDRRQVLREAHKYSRWLEREGWLETALDFYEHAARLVGSHDLGSPQAQIAFLLTRAELALELSQVDECRRTLEPLAALTEMVRSESGAIRARLLQGQLAMQQDDLVEALEHFRHSANAAEAINDPDLLAFSLLALARWHDRYGDPLAGQRMLDGAMNLYNRWGTYRMDLGTRALMLNRAVRLLIHRGLHERAGRMMDDLRALSERSGLAVVACRADWAEAFLAGLSGEYEVALERLSAARQRAADHGLRSLCIELLQEQAAVALDADAFDLVLELTAELDRLAQTHEDLFSQQRARDLRATASCMLGREIEASVNHLMGSLIRARERQVPRDIHRCHVNLHRALKAVGRSGDAEQHRMQADILAARMRQRAAA